jgi:hypothetical protein
MKVKNLTAKPIGFGAVVLLPDQTAELPKGFGVDHPTTKYYISRNWLKVVGEKNPAANKGGESVDVNAKINTGEPDPNADDNDEDDDDEGDGEKNPAAKPVDRLNLEELKALATELGIEFAEGVTRKVLIDAIKAAKKGNE